MKSFFQHNQFEIDDDLYQEEIMDHYVNPRNVGVLDPCDAQCKDENPLCGDSIEVYLRMRDECIDEVRFRGSGCAISQAAASMITEDIQGKRKEDVIRFNSAYISELIGVRPGPARMKCAMLALRSIQKALIS